MTATQPFTSKPVHPNEGKPLFGYIVTDENGQWMQDRYAKAWLTDLTITGPGDYTVKGWQHTTISSVRRGGIEVISKGRPSLYGLSWYYDHEHSQTKRMLSRAWEVESVGWTDGNNRADTIRVIREIPREEALAICYDEANPYPSKGWFAIRDKDTQRHAIAKMALELLDTGRFTVTGHKNHGENAVCTPAVSHPDFGGQFFRYHQSMKLKGDVVALLRLALVKFGFDFTVEYSWANKKYPKELGLQKLYINGRDPYYQSFETPVYDYFSSLEMDCIVGAVENFGPDAFDIFDAEWRNAPNLEESQAYARAHYPALMYRTEALSTEQAKAFEKYRKSLPKLTADRLRLVLENMIANGGKLGF